MTELPKIIHRIWLGSRARHSFDARFARSWHHFLPDWEIREWTDANIGSIDGLIMKDVINDTAVAPVVRSDILRVELLRLYGGLYIDVDVECLRHCARIFTPGYFTYTDSPPGAPNNGIMAAPPSHPVTHVMCAAWKSLLDSGVDFKKVDCYSVTGPHSLARALNFMVNGNWTMEGSLTEDGRAIGALWPARIATLWAQSVTPNWGGDPGWLYMRHHFAYSWGSTPNIY